MILALVLPHTAGDPLRDQRWLNCRLLDIQQQLADQGHQVSKPVISRLLRQHGYTLRANVKQTAGKQHPDRDRQFWYIRTQRRHHLDATLPVISVDTKKKGIFSISQGSVHQRCQDCTRTGCHAGRGARSGHDAPSDRSRA
jgi:hypothetical protein